MTWRELQPITTLIAMVTWLNGVKGLSRMRVVLTKCFRPFSQLRSVKHHNKRALLSGSNFGLLLHLLTYLEVKDILYYFFCKFPKHFQKFPQLVHCYH